MKRSDINALLALMVSPYVQGFADAKDSGTRYGPVHLLDSGGQGVSAICGRRVKRWNFEGETDSDYCARCLRVARDRENAGAGAAIRSPARCPTASAAGDRAIAQAVLDTLKGT